MTERKPARDTYDATVGIEQTTDPQDSQLFAVVKRAWKFEGSRLVPTEAVPLKLALTPPHLSKKQLPPEDADDTLFKTGVDVIVQGNAMTRGRAKFTRHTVGVRAGMLEKTAAVFGDREAFVRSDGRVEFTAPGEIDEVPLVWENAYGGIDPNVALDPLSLMFLEEGNIPPTLPGMYPRNVGGTGFVSVPQPGGDSVGLPNVEDPSDLLTPSRLVCARMEDWWKQPLPWGFGWMPLGMFPRHLWLGIEPEYEPDDYEALAEVKRHFMFEKWQEKLDDPAYSSMVFQAASHGLVLPSAPRGTMFAVAGMTEDGAAVSFELPEAPVLTFRLGSHTEKVAGRATAVVIRPNDGTVTATYVARIPQPGRKYIPGIFSDIPLSLSVDGDAPIAYERPPTVDEMMAMAKAAEKR